ncbi:MAG TPA: response regulator transcription factor [Candidatus Sulfobium mesophilum]|uniref:Response regulator with a HTH DNA-binding domain n=1 Tax=Candidatus Sulfobium mesophilum TaxID=2016548 RepID=A0A2U3QEL6_9BACT|nr:Response regulator with a HTH DNA-binding domain [Candidatus Sulfobium mesophilum]HSB31472.1 response regulator transcription factor [Candidatus Sulfobium mesophilum]
MIKILIADDHRIVREGLKQILAETEDMVVADEASNVQEVLKKVAGNDYDVLLLDISMPGRSGLDILKQLKSERPKLSVLVLSMYSEEQYALRALRAGASGYMTKESAPDELIEAIRKVSTGRKYISPAVAEKLAVSLESNDERPPQETLSDREFQVMCMIASGKTVKAIADELALSIKTVSTYRARILEKMRMKNNAELTHYAIQNKLVE